MAEIQVERNRNPSFLPWLVGLLLLAAVVFVVARTVGPWSEPDATARDADDQGVGVLVAPDPAFQARPW
ncbi:MAG: hypothetical protein WEB88_05055 [Gemmatimonadota bacterium]